jgi:uncharacterized protein YdiU (UPF0061 family)
MMSWIHPSAAAVAAATVVQYAIEAAEAGDYSELDRLMQVLAAPYDEQPEADPKYSSKPPPEMVRPGVCVLSCSS